MTDVQGQHIANVVLVSLLLTLNTVKTTWNIVEISKDRLGYLAGNWIRSLLLNF